MYITCRCLLVWLRYSTPLLDKNQIIEPPHYFTPPNTKSPMPSNKDRLYVALYARGGEPKMPKKEDK